MPPHGAPKRPKIAPRRVQDRLGSMFFSLRLSLRFLIVSGSVLIPIWPPKWRPGGAAERAKFDLGRAPGWSWGRLGALFGSTCGLGSFLNPLRPFLGPFLASWSAMYGLLGANFRFLGAVLVSFFVFSGRCSFASCPFAFHRLSLFLRYHHHLWSLKPLWLKSGLGKKRLLASVIYCLDRCRNCSRRC